MREIKFRIWNTKKKKMHLPFNNCSITYNLSYFENTKHVKFPIQYTGLVDKNNFDIYEGDIVKDTDYKDKIIIGKVIYRLASFYVEWNTYPPSLLATGTPIIIGNIYETPELLKG